MFTWLKKILTPPVPSKDLDPQISIIKNQIPDVRPPEVEKTHKEIANALLDAGNLAEAEIHYQKAIKQNKADTNAYVMLGYVLKEQGKSYAAAQQLEIALQLSPEDFDAHYMLASMASIAGRRQEAIQRYEKVIDLKPQFQLAYREYSYLMAQTGDLEKAQSIVDLALTHIPDEADFYLIKGDIFIRQHLVDSAILAYQKAISIRSDFSQAYLQLSLAFESKGKLTDAFENADKATSLNPENLAALVTRGNMLMLLERGNEALASFKAALKIKHDCVEALVNSGILLQLQHQNSEALKYYQLALDAQPNLAIVWHNKSVIEFDHGHLDMAMKDVECSLEIDPRFCDAVHHKGLILTALGRYYEALSQFAKALQIDSQHLLTFFNRAKTYQKLEMHEEALLDFAEAIRIQPDFAKAHFDESFSRLVLGDFLKGWAKYEWRWKCSPFVEGKRHFIVPLWLGEQPLKNKTILLYGEQGLGDTINFVRYVTLVAKLGARVILEVQASLKTLLKNFDGAAEVFAQGEVLPSFDYHCPLPSLPCAFNTALETIPVQEKYFDIDEIAPDAATRWQLKVGQSTDKKVGIVWSGNRDHQNDKNRSIPFSEFSKIIVENVQFFSLQKEVRSRDQTALDQQTSVKQWGGELTDFVETAALISKLDLVIAVDTSVAHLAASLGKPVWLLVPFNPDWRWMHNRSDSPWYKTVTLFRQKETGNWNDVLEEIAMRLASI
ncbi:tetratricopeptide repeat protein [Undibacterium sp. RTI2.2]|uniref:tetratricopeptide repeat protein n=2 Tax=Undibacterium TaxID=401469 RepID=UPI002AB449B0|nr:MULTISPECIES: tetratricopeptide repeat protein [unclassified Undibacterium]MDY7539051.1 tetratricopeptide repeat protein [Undibacterium sp. 5I1]MEB0115871.1 tetratricopeptide repeat protein [Undibacterium sp. RTI2.2]MEB0229815.1 tetratricopeptide repeat protein [Undibacterium sp. 10I3]MEB0258280.1 tetratricopeptide repeat protein [Undibacterium sp. 5I1]